MLVTLSLYCLEVSVTPSSSTSEFELREPLRDEVRSRAARGAHHAWGQQDQIHRVARV